MQKLALLAARCCFDIHFCMICVFLHSQCAKFACSRSQFTKLLDMLSIITQFEAHSEANIYQIPLKHTIKTKYRIVNAGLSIQNQNQHPTQNLDPMLNTPLNIKHKLFQYAIKYPTQTK